MPSKSLVQFSVDGQGCVPSLFFGLRPNYGRGNDTTVSHSTHTSARDPAQLTGKSGSVPGGDTAPFPWLTVHTRFYLCPPRVCFPSLVEVL